jgi:hypothetical protein
MAEMRNVSKYIFLFFFLENTKGKERVDVTDVGYSPSHCSYLVSVIAPEND